MQMHKPIDITLRIPIAILNKQSRKLILGPIQPLPRKLHDQRLTPPHTLPVSEQIPNLGVEMGIKNRECGEKGVEGIEGGFTGTEEVFEEVWGDVGVKPEETGLAIIDKVCTAFLDAGEGGTDARGEDKVAGLGFWEAGVWGEGVEGDDAGVEVEGEFEGTH